MTTWPSGTKATTTHTDAGTDRPRLAREDINQNILNTNDIIDYFNGGGPITTTGDQIAFNTGYKETINTLTSSTSIDVDGTLSSVHKVVLSHNTVFTFNLDAGESVSVIIQQDSDGTYNTATFTSDGSTQILFPRYLNTALTSAADAIDIVNVFSDGTNLYGNILRDMSV